MRILFVCTGNQCRSPMAERLAVAYAEQALAGSPELAVVNIGSAGLDAVPGRAMHAASARAVARLGGDPGGFRSRVFTAQLAEDADLVLTMTRNQRRAVLTAAPNGLRRTFMLTEAAGLLSGVDPAGLRLLPLTERARELARRLDEQRRRSGATGNDILDPVLRRASVHDQVAVAVATALRPLADVLFASVREQPAVPVEDAPEPETVEVGRGRDGDQPPADDEAAVEGPRHPG